MSHKNSREGAEVGAGALFRQATIRIPEPPRKARSWVRIIGLIALVVAAGFGFRAWRRWRRWRLVHGPVPSFEVVLPECEMRAAGPGPITRLAVWQVGPGRAGRGVVLESNGRWERRETFPDSQFTLPDEVFRGCVEPSRFAPVFHDFQERLAHGLDTRPADQSEHRLDFAAPCLREYTDARGVVTRSPDDVCEGGVIAQAVIDAAPRHEPGIVSAHPPRCGRSPCVFVLTVGWMPHPHEGGGALRSVSLRRNGEWSCDIGNLGDPVSGSLRPPEGVFAWLTATGVSGVEPMPTGTHEPVLRAVLLDPTGREVQGIRGHIARARWNEIARRLPAGCRVE